MLRADAFHELLKLVLLLDHLQPLLLTDPVKLPH
jgi:hypothetical protein